MMKVHVLQHVPFEGLGSIEAWLAHRGARVTFTRFFESDQLPELADVDFIIALGGPMSVNDEAQLAWLRAEQDFIAAAILANKAVLGICLGAQIIAKVLGAKIYPGPAKEIGWFPIFAESVSRQTFVFPARTLAFHWHGETFDLPPGAVHLARSTVCRNQAFQFGERAIGLQFHLETTPASADALIRHCGNELVPLPSVQTEAALRSVSAGDYARINQLLTTVLDYLVRNQTEAA